MASGKLPDGVHVGRGFEERLVGAGKRRSHNLMIPSNEPPEARVPGMEERARREVTDRVAVRYEKRLAAKCLILFKMGN